MELTGNVLDISNIKQIRASRSSVKQRGEIIVDGKRVVIKITLGDTPENMLHTLAHEMAHILEWEHTPLHLKITGDFFALYTRHVFRLGLP